MFRMLNYISLFHITVQTYTRATILYICEIGFSTMEQESKSNIKIDYDYQTLSV